MDELAAEESRTRHAIYERYFKPLVPDMLNPVPVRQNVTQVGALWAAVSAMLKERGGIVESIKELIPAEQAGDTHQWHALRVPYSYPNDVHADILTPRELCDPKLTQVRGYYSNSSWMQQENVAQILAQHIGNHFRLQKEPAIVRLRISYVTPYRELEGTLGDRVTMYFCPETVFRRAL